MVQFSPSVSENQADACNSNKAFPIPIGSHWAELLRENKSRIVGLREKAQELASIANMIDADTKRITDNLCRDLKIDPGKFCGCDVNPQDDVMLLFAKETPDVVDGEDRSTNSDDQR